MNRQFGARAIAVVLLAVAAAAGIGYMAYNAGVAHGIAEASRVSGTPGAINPYLYMWPRPWGFGFGFFPLLFVLLWFFLLRRVLWGRPRWWGRSYDEVPPRFEEWHRRVHERDATKA